MLNDSVAQQRCRKCSACMHYEWEKLINEGNDNYNELN